MNGEGTYTYKENKAIFKGRWKNGKKEGFG